MFGKPKGYDKIVSVFTKTIQQLDALYDYYDEKVDKNIHKITDLRNENRDLENEQHRAIKLQTRLNALVDVED